MTLVEALISRRRFTRPELGYSIRFDGMEAVDDYGNRGRFFDAREVVAEDWQIELEVEPTLTLTKQELAQILDKYRTMSKNTTQCVHEVFSALGETNAFK